MDASQSYDPDKNALSFKWWIQEDAGKCPENMKLNVQRTQATLNLPQDCEAAEIHVICEVRDNTSLPLVNYRRIIISVCP
jgi:hypothetical protein